VATLLQICVEQRADLLIVGTHARLDLDRRVLGPVADALVRQAPCPVLIARPKSHVGVTHASLGVNATAA
jgi:nucleotide-binding universal stress UspA family protein